jgi:acetolactate synthase small subunit
MHSRRELLATGLGSIVVLGSPSFVAARERQQPDSHDFAAGWNSSRMSPAVMRATAAALAQVISAGANVTNEQLAVADHSWHVLVAHLDEMDFMTATDKLLRERDDVLVSGPPSEETVSSVSQLLVENNVDISTDRLRSMLTTTPERVSAAVDRVRRHGIRETMLSIRFDPNSVAAMRQHRVAAAGPHALDAGSPCGVLQLMVDIIAITGAAWLVGCAATLGACIPCCVGGAILELAALVLEGLHDFLC